jgi:hypothetical protein
MDIKIEGINEEIMERALEQAIEARLHILGQMNTVLDAPREITSENAPSMTTLKVDQDKIRDIIGKGGATIRQITEESGATVDIDDDGTVKVFGQNASSARCCGRDDSWRSRRKQKWVRSTPVRWHESSTLVPLSRSCPAKMVWCIFRRSPMSVSRTSRLSVGRSAGSGQGARCRPARAYQAVHARGVRHLATD